MLQQSKSLTGKFVFLLFVNDDKIILFFHIFSSLKQLELKSVLERFAWEITAK